MEGEEGVGPARGENLELGGKKKNRSKISREKTRSNLGSAKKK